MNTITHNGLTFSVSVEPDTDMGEPWKEEDGHGVVSGWRRGRDKTAGERELCSYRGSYRFYDVPETLKIAQRDGWGLGATARMELAVKLGREPTAREVTAEAVERDFQRMRAWCNEEWYWCGVVVTLLDVDGNVTDERDSLWGIESDSGDYPVEVAQELVEQIAARVGDAVELVKHTRIREVA